MFEPAFIVDAIVLFTRGHFAPPGQDWKLGAMMGGLFRDYCA